MTREVVLTDEALQQMHLAAEWYQERSPRVADEWFAGLASAIADIAGNPQCFALARLCLGTGK